MHISLTLIRGQGSTYSSLFSCPAEQDRLPTLPRSFPILAPLALFSPSLERALLTHSLTHSEPLPAPLPTSSQVNLFSTFNSSDEVGLICCLLCLQNAKSYDDLKAELGNSGDWSQIADVSMGLAWLALMAWRWSYPWELGMLRDNISVLHPTPISSLFL